MICQFRVQCKRRTDKEQRAETAEWRFQIGEAGVGEQLLSGDLRKAAIPANRPPRAETVPSKLVSLSDQRTTVPPSPRPFASALIRWRHRRSSCRPLERAAALQVAADPDVSATALPLASSVAPVRRTDRLKW